MLLEILFSQALPGCWEEEESYAIIFIPSSWKLFRYLCAFAPLHCWIIAVFIQPTHISIIIIVREHWAWWSSPKRRSTHCRHYFFTGRTHEKLNTYIYRNSHTHSFNSYVRYVCVGLTLTGIVNIACMYFQLLVLLFYQTIFHTQVNFVSFSLFFLRTKRREKEKVKVVLFSLGGTQTTAKNR